MTPALPKILVIDDHELVRAGLRGVLSAAEGFDVVAEPQTVYKRSPQSNCTIPISSSWISKSPAWAASKRPAGY